MGEEGVYQARAFTPQYAPIESLLRTRKCYTRDVILGLSTILKTVLGSASEAPPRCVPPGIADLVSKAVYMLSRLLLWLLAPANQIIRVTCSN